MRTRYVLPALALSLSVTAAACGSDSKPSASPTTDATTATTAAEPTPTTVATASITANDLRSLLEFQLQEHVYLAGFATGQALAGNTAGFEAAAATLDANSNDIVKSIGTVYGDAAGKAFDPLWKKHIGFFVNYTQAIAKNDAAGAAKAKADLTAYASEFGAFIESATEGKLPKAAVAELLGEHAGSLIAAIDAQKAGDAKLAYSNLKKAAAHMTMIAKPLADTIAQQKSFAGSATSPAADLRAALNRLMQEHVYLAGAATGEALAGNTAGFDAAAATLGSNSDDVAAAIASVYGDAAGKAFDPLWKKHIGFFVNYTQAIAKNDAAGAAKAKADLTAYASEFGAFIESATEGKLPKAAVAELLGEHAGSLIAAIDAQKAGDAKLAYTNLKAAAGHMPMIADALAKAIAEQKGLQ